MKRSIQIFIKRKSRFFTYIIATVSLLFAIFFAVSSGSAELSYLNIATILIDKWLPFEADIDGTYTHIIHEIRLPRIFLAMFVGASLALAGAAFQGLLKNPLADPYTLGVSSGSALGAVLVIYFGFSLPFLGSLTLPFVAIIGGFLSLIFVISFAKMVQRQLTIETMILTGIVFSSFLGSLLSLFIALSGDELRQIIHWLLGSVAMRGWEHVFLLIPFFIIGYVILQTNARELNAFAFGEGTAHDLGINVEKRRILILFAASLMTGAAVSVSGTIGFVGLVVPHFVRLLIGADHKHLLPISAIVGGTFLILADLFARTIIAPTGLPLGVVTALVGAPAFGVILLRRKMS
nr:iron ABC transporter permease [Texcoconibacillus texcoconensis]